MNQSCTDFWIEACTEYLVILKAAFYILLPNAASYMCALVFLPVIKNKIFLEFGY